VKNQKHKIALYIRVSTEEQAANPEGSIKSQEQRLRSHVEFKNSDSPFGEVVAVYIDRARSGKDTNRPQLQKMLAAILNGELSLVMVTELSRLSRSIRDFCSIWDLMRACHCEFQSLREQFDTTSAAGEMVLYTIANIAQFERRQISERVSANFEARSARGLYNGGSIPVGYKRVPDKKGYLEIDERVAPTVQKAFAVFLKEESLTHTARWLNQNGYRLPKEKACGARKQRLGYFTISNLYTILKNKAYAGIKTYKSQGEVKDVTAVWKPIIEKEIFNRVQERLSKNCSVKKPNSDARYPYILSGLLYCSTCQRRLSGKSAHGNGGKICYYDHAWAAKKKAALGRKIIHCKPARILAKRIEPLVWDMVEALLEKPEVAHDLITKAKLRHAVRKQNPELEHANKQLQELMSQSDLLAERLSMLPRNLSADSIFKQMEKLEEQKAAAKKRLESLNLSVGPERELPVDFESYEALLMVLKGFKEEPLLAANKAKIIEALVHKIEITQKSFDIHFYVGQNQIQGELAQASSPTLNNKIQSSDFFIVNGSKSLRGAVGGACRTININYLISLNLISCIGTYN